MSWDEHREGASPLVDGIAARARDAAISCLSQIKSSFRTHVRLLALMAAAMVAFDLLGGQYNWQLSSTLQLWNLAVAVLAVLGLSRLLSRLDPKTRHRLKQSVGGILWIAACATMVSLVTGRSLAVVFLGLLSLALSGGLIALFWIAGWAERDDARGGRFGIATLFLITAYVAVFLAAVRWTLVAAAERHGAGAAGPPLATMAGVSAVCLVLLFLSVPILIGLVDSVMWLAVWLIKKPWIQAMLAKYRRD